MSNGSLFLKRYHLIRTVKYTNINENIFATLKGYLWGYNKREIIVTKGIIKYFLKKEAVKIYPEGWLINSKLSVNISSNSSEAFP